MRFLYFDMMFGILNTIGNQKEVRTICLLTDMQWRALRKDECYGVFVTEYVTTLLMWREELTMSWWRADDELVLSMFFSLMQFWVFLVGLPDQQLWWSSYIEEILHYFDFCVYSVKVRRASKINVVCGWDYLKKNLIQSLWQSLWYNWIQLRYWTTRNKCLEACAHLHQRHSLGKRLC